MIIKASGDVDICEKWIDPTTGRLEAELIKAAVIGIDAEIGDFVCLVTNHTGVSVRRVDEVWGEVTVDGRVVGGAA
ncbi:hypothetical protein [Methylopila sp. 73B]|uniref:hypothetical protein n=1 Tax=Methylopila sp. 73B TaxID=1120792 RepID=UPI0003627070|nr:hypothetical protein [Methylopila sp. 73B]